MRRRDFGAMVAAALGLTVLGVPRDARAAETLAKGTKFKVKAVVKEGKNYLQPSATVALKPGGEVKFEYVAQFGEKKVPAFKLIEVKPGTGANGIDTVIQGAPSPAFATIPKDILVVSAGAPKGEPIVVEQPGS